MINLQQPGSQKIIPFVWFESDMSAVTQYYNSLFPGSHIYSDEELKNTPSGNVQIVTMELFGVKFKFMAAGPYLPFNPTVSFIVSCDSLSEVDELWNRLSTEGKILMELSDYPFADKYGWIQDRYGISWQIMYSSSMNSPQKVIPALMFAGNECGRALEAVNFYTTVFRNSNINYVMKYDDSEPVDDASAVVKHAGITIENFFMALMDSNRPSPLTFQQSVSFVVNCEDQAEIDYYWEKLSEGGSEVQCGWLNDKFGLPWQIVPTILEQMMNEGSAQQVTRVTEAFMKMKKFDIQALQQAYTQ